MPNVVEWESFSVCSRKMRVLMRVRRRQNTASSDSVGTDDISSDSSNDEDSTAERKEKSGFWQRIGLGRCFGRKKKEARKKSGAGVVRMVSSIQVHLYAVLLHVFYKCV